MWEWVTDDQLITQDEPNAFALPRLAQRPSADPFATKGSPRQRAVARRPAAKSFDPANWFMVGLFVVLTASLAILSFLFDAGQAKASMRTNLSSTPSVSSQTVQPSESAAILPSAPAVAAVEPAPVQRKQKGQIHRLGALRQVRGVRSTPRTVDDLFDAAFKTPRAGRLSTTPTREDILTGVRLQAKALSGCVTKARNWGEISSGRTTFVLDWTINPDGSIAQPRLTGPAHVLGTLLPDCFAARMANWQFPASVRGAPVIHFPLAVTLR